MSDRQRRRRRVHAMRCRRLIRVSERVRELGLYARLQDYGCVLVAWAETEGRRFAAVISTDFMIRQVSDEGAARYLQRRVDGQLVRWIAKQRLSQWVAESLDKTMFQGLTGERHG
jgi:hypothetical protein